MSRKVIFKKILPEYFNAVICGDKRFELRKDEDDAQPGDILILREWDGEKYTNRNTYTRIDYVLRDCPQYGLMDGHCIMSLSGAAFEESMAEAMVASLPEDLRKKLEELNHGT